MVWSGVVIDRFIRILAFETAMQQNSRRFGSEPLHILRVRWGQYTFACVSTKKKKKGFPATRVEKETCHIDKDAIVLFMCEI